MKGIGWTLFGVIGLLSGCGSDQTSAQIEAKYTNSASQFIKIGRKSVHYRDEGVGEVVILLHGTSSSLHAWDQWAKRLKQDFRVVRMDLPGFGLTGHESFNRYEISDDVVFLNMFMEALGVNKAHIVGSSLGGRIAWEYSLHHPDDVMSLTLLNALGYPQETWPPGIEMAQWPVVDKLMEWVTPKFMFRQGLKEVYFDPQLVTDELIDRYYDLMTYNSNRQAFTQRVKASLDQDADKIRDVSVPTFIMWGREDLYFPVENAARFSEDIEHSQLVVYENVGHLPMEEIPQQSVNDFKQFTSELSHFEWR